MSNPYAAYPVGADVQAALVTTGLSLTGIDSAEFDAAACAAWECFEGRAGWDPYLAATGYQQRLFDPPRQGSQAGRIASDQGGRRLDLGAGILDMPDNGLVIGYVVNTELEMGLSTGQLSDEVGSAGTVLRRGVQYYLRPDNAPQQGRPFTYVDFLTPTLGVPQSIMITAVWGYTKALSADVWLAIRNYGASILAGQLNLVGSSGLTKFAADTITIQYAPGSDPGSVMGVAAKWERDFLSCAFRKRRMTA